VAETRREHPAWGPKRIRMELLRKPVAGVMVVPSTATINRILTRQGLVVSRPRKRPRDSYVRWERPGPMQLWGMDIVGGVMLVNPVTGEVREAKVVTAVDDHSRFCVSAQVVQHATSRAVCLAFAEALVRFGVPEEILTDNGKQFTDRFGKGGEVLFDKICRKNAITHRLTGAGVAEPEREGGAVPWHVPAGLPGPGGAVHFDRSSAGRGGCLGRALQRRAAAPGPGRQGAGHARGTVRARCCPGSRVARAVAAADPGRHPKGHRGRGR